MTAFRRPQTTPPHTVRVSARARRIRLSVTPRDGLVVVLPRESDRRRVPALLREHEAWIARALARTEERRRHIESAADAPLPDRVELRAVGESLPVEYRDAPAGGPARCLESAGRLVVTAPSDDPAAARAALRRWLTRAARSRLAPMLEEAAARQGLSYAGVTVRAQRSRWGSCSRTGSISLNRCLLFLHPRLAENVLVHELLHTRRHDHSPAFWNELAKRVPGSEALRRELRDAWRLVPPWAEPD